MKGLWLGMFGLCIFMFVMTVGAFTEGGVTIYYPLANLAAAVICYRMYRG